MIAIVPVTAIAYAAAIADELRKPTTTATQATISSQFASGM